LIKGRTVRVHDDNVEKALRKLKKKVNNDGRLWEVRQRQEYEKPSHKRKIAKQKARSRYLKQLAKQKNTTY